MPLKPRLLVPVEKLLALFRARTERICGVSVSGGEPTDQHEALTALLTGLKSIGLSTVVFTGHLYEELRVRPEMRDILNSTDLLIDGPFVEAERDLSLHWRGSRNQRLIRLSDVFSDTELLPRGPGGEILFTADSFTCHGIASQAITDLIGRGHEPAFPEMAQDQTTEASRKAEAERTRNA
jgi:anaerobic ribonucleoside-triphosphate reductase activating protein